MTRILCLRLPHWPLQRLTHARPELKRRPLGLYEERQGRRVVVTSTKPNLLPGTPVADALGVHWERLDPFADRSALERMAVWCEQFCPVVGIEEGASPSSLFLDITGLAVIIAGERELAEQILRALARRHLHCQVAIADTPSLAWAATHGGDSPHVVPAGDRQVLANLALATLRLEAKVLAVLVDLGLQRVGQLLDLPRAGLASRFGQSLIDRMDQLTGAKPELICPHHAEPEMIARREFEDPIESREVLEIVLRELVTEVSTTLVARQHGAVQLTCRFKCQRDGQSEETQFLVGLHEASGNARHLRDLLRMQLEQCELPGPVSAISLAVMLSARLVPRQRELFAANQDSTRELSLLIDRLGSRLGREAVLRPRLGADAQPEYAYRYEFLVGKLQRLPAAEQRSLPERPLFCERAPVLLTALAIAPEGAPQRFRFQGQDQRILRSWGPERIQTGWWRGQYIRRDYYRVECDNGRRYWLFRSSGQWFLHGVFD